jgi:hypothetical protein
LNVGPSRVELAEQRRLEQRGLFGRSRVRRLRVGALIRHFSIGDWPIAQLARIHLLRAIEFL